MGVKWIFGWILGVIVLCSLGVWAASRSVAQTTASKPSTRIGLDVERDRLYLQEVIRRHPREEVSKILSSSIEAGDIQIQWVRGPHADGRFKPIPVLDNAEQLIDLMGTLSISLELVDRARRGDRMRQAYLRMVLLHEAVHHEQIADGRFPAEIVSSPGLTREDCLRGWQFEREAYYRECQYAMDVGESSIIQVFCVTLDPETFDRNLLPLLSANRADTCPAIWAEEFQQGT